MRAFRTVLVSLIGLALSVWASGAEVSSRATPTPFRQACDVTGFSTTKEQVASSLDPGVLYGFLLSTADQGLIQDVVFEMDLQQFWVGDLVTRLYYDIEGDGSPDAGPVEIICRPMIPGCPFPDDCCGCDGDLIGIYRFGDEGIEPLAEFACPPLLPNECYLPAIESPVGFSVFAGLPSGGVFTVEIGDAIPENDTFLNSVTVHYLTEGGTWQWICEDIGEFVPPPDSYEFTCFEVASAEESSGSAVAGQVRVYPNPTTGPMAMEVALQRPGRVRVEILDLGGRLIRVLRDAFMDAGVHRLLWDGMSDKGEDLPTGIYFYRVVRDGDPTTGKLMLIR